MTDTSKLIERLRYPIHAMRPTLSDGRAAADALEAAQQRIAELEEHVSDLLEEQECACGYDNPTDICLGHMPLFNKLIDALHDAITRPKGVVPASAEKFYSAVKADAAENAAQHWGRRTDELSVPSTANAGEGRGALLGNVNFQASWPRSALQDRRGERSVRHSRP